MTLFFSLNYCFFIMNNLCFFFCFGLLSVFTVYNYTERKIWTFVRSFEIFLTSKRFTITISYTVRCIFCLIKKKTLSLSFYQIKYKCVFFAFCIFNCCHQTLNSLIYIWVTILHARNCLHRLEHQFKAEIRCNLQFRALLKTCWF